MLRSIDFFLWFCASFLSFAFKYIMNDGNRYISTSCFHHKKTKSKQSTHRLWNLFKKQNKRKLQQIKYWWKCVCTLPEVIASWYCFVEKYTQSVVIREWERKMFKRCDHNTIIIIVSQKERLTTFLSSMDVLFSS